MPLLDNLADSLYRLTLEQLNPPLDAPSALPAFERALHDLLMQIGRQVLTQALQDLEPDRPVEDGPQTWTRVATGRGTYTSRFGDVTLRRGLYRAIRNGPTRCFVEERAQILDGCWTPEAARLSLLLLTEQTSRSAAHFLAELGAMTPSRSKLDRLPRRAAQTVEQDREQLEATLRASSAIPPEATTAAVLLDGVMVKLQGSDRKAQVQRAKAQGRKVGGPIGSSEASVGALVFYDAEGKRLVTRRFARMPEPDKAALKACLRQELAWVRQLRPDLVVVAVSDGAPNNWSFLESLEPDHQIVDFYHVMEHIHRRLDAALGVDTHPHQAAAEQLKELLLSSPEGHRLAFEMLERIEKQQGTFKVRKKAGRGAQPTFYERHQERMAYLEHRQLGLPLGSGVIEGTARYLVVDRLRRTGMRWKQAGGQAMLAWRQYAANGQFNEAWSIVLERESANNQAHWAAAA